MHAADTTDAARPTRRPAPPARRPWWHRGLRGDGVLATMVATGILVYGLATTVVFVVGRVLGDATGWLYLANLSTIYWLAPAVGLLAFAAAARWWVPALACLLGAVVWLATFGPLFVPQATAAEANLRVATYNVQPIPRVDHIARLVESAHPDVLLLQEVVPGAQDALVAALPSLPYHHFATVNLAAPGGGGTAVFSRLPMTGTRSVTGLSQVSRPVDIVTVRTATGAVDVVSVHLTSPCDECLSSDLEDVSTNAASLRRLEDESRLRDREIERIIAALPSTTVLVGGDLNSSTLNTPRRALLRTGLTDLHRASGAGPGFTRFHGQWGFRIDWLFASPDVTPVREWVGSSDASDHRPVIADIVLPAASGRD